MSQEQQQDLPGDAEPGMSGGSPQQEQQQERHAGQGSDSIIKELREREHRRNQSSVRRRTGPTN